MAVALVLAASASVVGQPGDGSQMEDHVHVSVDSGSCPFALVVYGVRRLGDVGMAFQMKEFPVSHARDNRVKLVSAEEVDSLIRDLVELGALAGASEDTRRPLSIRWRVDVAYRGTVHHFSFEGDPLAGDPRLEIVRRVRSFVEERTGEILFRDIGVPVHRFGTMNLRTFPRCRVVLDGVDLHKMTPVYNVDVVEGEHEVLLICPSLQKDRRIRFQVYPEQVKDLNIDLTQ
jgi:hypothetical protein